MVDGKFYEEMKFDKIEEPVTSGYMSVDWSTTTPPENPNPEYWVMDENGFWMFQFKEGISYAVSSWSTDTIKNLPESFTDVAGTGKVNIKLLRKTKEYDGPGLVYCPYRFVTTGTWMNNVFYRSKKIQAEMMVRRLKRSGWPRYMNRRHLKSL